MAVVDDTIVTTRRSAAVVALVDAERVRGLRKDYEDAIWALVRDAEAALAGKEEEARRQDLLAEYVSLAGHLSKANSEDLYCSALFGLAAFQHGMPGVARSISRDVRFAASTTAALGEVMRGLVYSVGAAFALAYLAFLPVFLVNVFGRGPALWAGDGGMVAGFEDFLTSNSQILVGAAFGFLGSIVSLLLRLGEFEVMRGRSRQFLFLTGFTLPVVGGTFAAVISALFASHVVTFSLSGKDSGVPDIKLFVLIGFLSGFSERFSRSLLTSMESRLTSSLDREGRPQALSRAARTDVVARRRVRRNDPDPPGLGEGAAVLEGSQPEAPTPAAGPDAPR